jgi:Ca-activated chloride channel family protein
VVLPPLARRDRARIEAAIDGLQPNGSTNTEAGLVDGYAMAEGAFHAGWVNRVILCTDGVANVGQTGAGSIHARIADQAKRGIELTAVGVGLGNYNDVLLEQLADAPTATTTT